jgi:hypothetical protein
MHIVLPSVKTPLCAIAVLAGVSACNAILGLGDPIDRGGPDASTESAIAMEQAGDDGPLADQGPGGSDAGVLPNPKDSAAPKDASNAIDGVATAPDVGSAPDAAMAGDAPAQEAGGPCANAPVGFICGCQSRSDCVDAGGCCCVAQTLTLCDTTHNCSVYDQGSCL